MPILYVGPGGEMAEVVTEAVWTILMNAQIFDNVTTEVDSDSHDIDSWGALWALIFIESANAPTNVRILAQWSHDGGTTWWDFEEGLWASLMWEDVDTGTPGVYKAFLLPCGGIDLIRFRVVATGTAAADTFTVTIRVRSFRGNFEAAHS